MIFLKILSSFKSSVLRKHVIDNVNTYSVYRNFIKSLYSGTCSHNSYDRFQNRLTRLPNLARPKTVIIVHRKWCSNNLLDDTNETDLTHISKLFPEPRVTLNEFATKRDEKIFDVYYKQQTVAPKGAKKKSKIIPKNTWSCTYAFVWPEKEKFECTAISKKQAAEKAAFEAVNWLYEKKCIDKHGNPVYDSNILHDLKEKLNEPICVKVDENSVERILRIWDDYQNNIKDIFVKTHEKASQRDAMPAVSVLQDSTVDNEDEYYEEELEDEESSNECSEVNRKIHPVYGRIMPTPTSAALDRRDKMLRRLLESTDEELTPLPIDEYTSSICDALDKSRVLVIVGTAGCGKSTRAPAAILRRLGAAATLLVAEPRRVAAIGLAHRVADELQEDVGSTVGYQVRLRAKLPSPPGGSILYCTSGILLRRLQVNPGLEGCSHVFIDEAHERDINTDIALLLLKKAMKINLNLKVIIMSATLDTEIFTRYFDSCPIIEVPGRTYPVDITYLEDMKDEFDHIDLSNTLENCRKENGKPYIDCNEVVNVIKAIDSDRPEGAILVFLPGWAEIKTIRNILEQHFGDSGRHMILPVHSRLSTSDQTKMFGQPPPGVRKIVLSTNIAETSVTIPDVVYVVDCGAHKENRARPDIGISSLERVWISQAAAKQRSGRAGRIRPGHCFRLYTRDKENSFPSYNTPEILRVPLEQTVLTCKSYSPEDKVENFLKKLPEPPNDTTVQYAIDDLVDLGALSMPNQKLTRLGCVLSGFTSHPRLGCMLLHSAVFGNVVSVANLVTHLATNIEVFANAGERKEEIRNIKREFSPHSDHTALHNIQQRYECVETDRVGRQTQAYCDKYGLRRDRLMYCKAISSLYLEQLVKSGILETECDVDEYSRFSDVNVLSKATILSGSNCILVTRRHLKTRGKLTVVKSVFTSRGERAHIGVDSVNYSLTKDSPGADVSMLTYFGGYHSSERRALVLYQTSLLSPHTVLLFSKGEIVQEPREGNSENVVLNLRKHRLKINIPPSQADVILKAREMLWSTLQYYIERDNKNLDLTQSVDIFRFKVRLVKAIIKLLNQAEKDVLHDNEVSSDHDD